MTGTHRHLLHSLLELRYQLGVEAADPWLEWLLAEAWWNHDEGEKRPLPDWREDPAMKEHLEAFPVLRSFLPLGEDAVRAILDWAGVPEVERDVYLAAANGFTFSAIAYQYGIRKVLVASRFANARARIQTALELSLREVAV